MSERRKRRVPKLSALLCFVPVIVVVALAVKGSRSPSINSARYPAYFDDAKKDFWASDDLASRQERVDLMAIALERISSDKIDGNRILAFADAIDDQRSRLDRAVEDKGAGSFSKQEIAKIGAQAGAANNWVRMLATADPADQANEVALAMVRDLPRRVSGNDSINFTSTLYLRHLETHLGEFDPAVRTRLVDASMVLFVLVDDSKSVDSISDKVFKVRSLLEKADLGKDWTDGEAWIFDTVEAMTKEPSARHLFYGSTQRPPQFFGAATRASLMGDWPSVETLVATMAVGDGELNDWYRHNGQVLAKVLTKVLMDHFKRAPAVDDKWLDGFELCMKLDGGSDAICQFIYSAASISDSDDATKPDAAMESDTVEVSLEERRRFAQVLEVVDGNPASDVTQLIRILNGAGQWIANDNPQSIDEALEVAEVLNATVMPRLIRQAFWELQFLPDAADRIAIAAVHRWVDRSLIDRATGELPGFFKSYPAHAHFLSAWAALDRDAIEVARYHASMAEKWGGESLDGLAALQARLPGS